MKVKYYVEAHIEYNQKLVNGESVLVNDSVSSIDIKKAYMRYGGLREDEVVIKYPRWFGGKSGYRELSSYQRKKLTKLPLCNSPEEYKEKWDELNITPPRA